MRAENPEDKTHWIEVLQSYKTAPDSNSIREVSLKRHGSTLSLQSNSLSTASTNSIKLCHRNLREKLNEIDTFKDILFNQVETLQRYAQNFE